MGKYKYIETNQQLEEFSYELAKLKQFSFDCEFSKNTRYKKKLSIIGIASNLGIAIIDCLSINEFKPFFKLIQSKSITKITHAGDNDYITFLDKFKILPINVIDTQILAQFISYKSGQNLYQLIYDFLEIKLLKDQSATDWLYRPLTEEQINYVINDIKFLEPLLEKLITKLNEKDRLNWALEHCKILERRDFYFQNDLNKILSNREVSKLNLKEFSFILKLLRWQKTKKDIYENDLFQKLLITDLLRTLPSGRKAVIADTRIKKSKLYKFIQEVIYLYESKVPQNDINEYENTRIENKEYRDNLIEFFYLTIKQICIEKNISINVILTRTDIKRIKNIKGYAEIVFAEQWKRDFIGNTLLRLILECDKISIDILKNGITIYLNEKITNACN